MRSRWLCGLMMCGAGIAQADTLANAGKIYAGVGAGVAQVSFDAGLKGDDTALQAFAGYAFNRFLAAEVGYLDAGSVESRYGAPVDTAGFSATALGIWPIGDRWALFMRGGALTWRWKSAGIEHTGIDVTYGAGGSVTIGRVQLRIEAGGSQLDDEIMRYALAQGIWRF